MRLLKGKTIFYMLVALFVVMNVAAILHAYRFTHFELQNTPKTNSPKELTWQEKLKVICLGISNPRPVNDSVPTIAYKTVRLGAEGQTSAWYCKKENAKGTVILFHGYASAKANLIERAQYFYNKQYSVLMVDFRGSGESEGNSTTIGFHESTEVRDAYGFIYEKGEDSIYLFGTSMGAVAVLKAVHDYQLDCDGLLLECPFGSMYKTVSARFSNMGVPAFPMAGLLTFWGGAMNDYWAMSHNPIDYANEVKCPTLLLYGEQDDKVSREEIDAILENMKGTKKMTTFAKAGHEDYWNSYKKEWCMAVDDFMIKPLH